MNPLLRKRLLSSLSLSSSLSPCSSAPSRLRRLCMVLIAIGLSAACAWGQATPLERTFHASKAEVESALRTMQADAGGRLPTVEGFVASQNQALERFQRPHYTFSIQVTGQAPAGSVVRVLARITAWYADPDPSQAGYRELPSSGRLETDLLERLEDSLGKSAVVPSTQPNSAPANPPAPEKGSVAASAAAPRRVPRSSPSTSKTPSGTTGSVFTTPRAGATSLPPRTQVDSSTAETRNSAKYLQDLRHQASDLEDILRNQSHPSDLAAVKQARTPVFDRPAEDAQVLFLADAEDEFQVLNTNADWVHVQISGLSRGWIRGSQLELPSASTNRAAARNGTAAGGQPFRREREEVNTFPGDWAPLRGKSVKIIWLEPTGSAGSTASVRWEIARSMFERASANLSTATPSIEGVVLIFDSADGGMAAATLTSLQEWRAGHLSDDAFRAQCSLDPPEAFQTAAGR